LTVDTNALIDNPDLAACTDQIGPRYMAHLLPVVLRELDDKKRAGRTDVLREAAKSRPPPERTAHQRRRHPRSPGRR